MLCREKNAIIENRNRGKEVVGEKINKCNRPPKQCRFDRFNNETILLEKLGKNLNDNSKIDERDKGREIKKKEPNKCFTQCGYS